MNLTNFEKLSKFMDFSDPGKFYLALVVQRRKDNPQMDRSERIIKNYMIPTSEKLEYVRDEMETLCEVFNARVYLYINRRSFKNTQKAMAKTLIDQICSDSVSNLNHLFDSCSASHGCGDKHWIIDVDLPKTEDLDSKKMLSKHLEKKIIEHIREIEPTGEKVELVLDTKNGFHMVVKPFDTRKFIDMVEAVDIHNGTEIELKKDAMVNLIF